MTLALAWFTTSLLLAIAFVHLLWALGKWWPIADEAELARAVVGRKGIARMPGAVACSLVVVALVAAAFWPVVITTGSLRSLGFLALAAVFLARGLASASGVMARICPEEPFATLDRRFYGPLCLTLGLAFALLWSLA